MEFLLFSRLCGNILDSEFRYRDDGNCHAVAQNNVKDIKETVRAPPKFIGFQAADNKKLKFIFSEKQGTRLPRENSKLQNIG